ncbi:MAG TPA: nucleotidyltransferase domain-containing protein [bacterium]|nr:nucleotidyltransferase domain-containing protein [bacterium]
MLTKKEILSFIKNNQEFLSREFHVTEIGIFGSFADKKQNSTSDIDFLVEFNTDKIDNYTENKAQLKNYLEEAFDRKIDICRKKYIRPYIKEHILKTTQYA